MRSFLLSVLFLLSGIYLFPQTTKFIKDFSPDGKKVLNYSEARLNQKSVIKTGNVPFGTQPDWQATLERQIGGLAWGDYDHDGDLDLAVGCYHSQSYPPINDYETEIYRNDNGVLTSLPAWSSTDMRSTTDIAWADINGDGYPDLLAANGDENQVPSVIYMNSAAGLETTPSWISQDIDWTVGAAFADINGDGYLDLAFGNEGNSVVPDRPICVFYNLNGTLDNYPDFITGDQMITNTVAFADVNNSDLKDNTQSFTADGTGSVYMLSMIPIYKIDSVSVNGNLITSFTEDDVNGWISLGFKPQSGDQVIVKYRYMNKADLAACKWVGYSSGVYFNQNGSLNPLPGWTVNNTYSQKGIAWADYNNDGYLDLAIGGSGNPTVVYKNDNGTLGTNPIWSSPNSNTSTQDLAWGDINNDGYPDLAVANFGYSTVEIYMNNAGVLESSPSWTYNTGSPATAIAFGDLNGDGYLDLAIGTARTPVVVFLNTSVVPVELISFQAKVNRNNVLLIWSTATESNNRGFEVERIQRSKNISQNWEKIGFVQGNGTITQQKTYSFIDKNITSGTYCYRLKQIDFDGKYKYSNEVEVNLNVPLKFALSQNYPNPFNPTTTISFVISHSSLVTLKIYDDLGREVTTLVNEEKRPGKYNRTFDASGLASGIYYCRLEADNNMMVKKMVLLK